MLQSIILGKKIEINVTAARKSMLKLYHKRWRHQNKRHVKKLLAKEKDIQIIVDREICEACVYSKAHCLPFEQEKVDGKSPSELWMGQKLRTSHLHIIGSTCYFYVFTEKNKKTDQKAEDIIFQEKISDFENKEIALLNGSVHEKEDEDRLVSNDFFEDKVTLEHDTSTYEKYRTDGFVCETEYPEKFQEALDSSQSTEWKKATNPDGGVDKYKASDEVLVVLQRLADQPLMCSLNIQVAQPLGSVNDKE
ncbi:Hypothetical protein CINCED_3A012230 [Cinara cedri]|uniref:Uncharacterized protein n=1 Tax=Cinara cedri TaxID=506608 RepID=A0A5E4NRD6_9HEMI|nr:Hypothetical protein CINCED_3A012230 [Cinara cedri]